MLTERIQSNNENHNQLLEDILALEKVKVSPEYLPMWNAENNSCFPHFIVHANDIMPELISQAKNGDKKSIDALTGSYQTYRDELEEEMKEYHPNIYKLYIEAISRGDEINASMYIEEYISVATNEKPVIEEDDDDE